jgi:hypothetical protein
MLSGFFKDTKNKSRLGFAILLVTAKLLKMTAMSKETSVICINERNYGKKQVRGIWHELCSRRLSVQLHNKSKRKGVK